jgi:HD-like signal output (HDOD) protein
VALLLGRFDDYAATLAQARAEPARSFSDIEDQRHGTNHVAIGCLLARNWGLSQDVSWAILHHHDYSVIDHDATDGAVRSLVALSLLAERALQAYQGHRESPEWDKGGASACAYLGLSSDEATDMLDQLLDCFTE